MLLLRLFSGLALCIMPHSICFLRKQTNKQTPQTTWLLNHRDVSLTVPEAGRSKVKVPESLVFAERPPPETITMEIKPDT